MLLVDIKTDGRRVYEVLRQVLASYPELVAGIEDGQYRQLDRLRASLLAAEASAGITPLLIDFYGGSLQNWRWLPSVVPHQRASRMADLLPGRFLRRGAQVLCPWL